MSLQRPGWALRRLSDYDRNGEVIIELYDEVGGNLSKLEEKLAERDISSSRRWVAIYLERWGVRAIRKRR